MPSLPPVASWRPDLHRERRRASGEGEGEGGGGVPACMPAVEERERHCPTCWLWSGRGASHGREGAPRIA